MATCPYCGDMGATVGARCPSCGEEVQEEIPVAENLGEDDGTVTAELGPAPIPVAPPPPPILEMDETELTACIARVLNERANGAQNRILVVDDDADIVGWLKHLLSHSGYRVTEAYDGMQALEALAAEKPDLILLDAKMPRMDGRTTLRRLRAEEEYRDIPVIVLSANAATDDAERRQLVELGVKELMSKPVTVEQLTAEIRKHLEKG